ncbi:MAG TPA: hypothetical protein VKE22_12350 [Haliangiales bacterium]|nr:hypothetical protein [Haliangiales bacterium]
MRGPGAAHSLLLLIGLVGLSACPTVDVGETPVAPPPCRPSFQKFMEPGGVWDLAINPPDQTKSCVAMNGCHTSDTGRSSLRLIPNPMSDSDWQLNYEVVTRFLNCSQPEASPLITKPEAGPDPHVGGDLWTCNSASCEPEKTIIDWINAR